MKFHNHHRSKQEGNGNQLVRPESEHDEILVSTQQLFDEPRMNDPRPENLGCFLMYHPELKLQTEKKLLLRDVNLTF